jgi:hypothetical protein
MAQTMNGWIGVDLDGTLAQYDKWVSPDHIGEPIVVMVDRVKGWLAAGLDVRIFTARVSHDGTYQRLLEARVARSSIENWCEQHFGRVLPITNVKDYAMLELWDDRAVQVEVNTGNLIGISTRGL